MRDAFKKFFAGNPAQPAAQAAHQEDDTQMSTTHEANAQAAATTIAELAASLEEATKTLASKESQFAEMSAKLEKINAALSSSEAAQATLAAQAKAKVVAERTEKLSAVIGKIKAPTMAASLEALDDTAFDLVVSSMSANLSAEAKSTMFTEAGVSVDAAAPKETDKPVSFAQFTPKNKETK